jgi:hypothetical protein
MLRPPAVLVTERSSLANGSALRISVTHCYGDFKPYGYVAIYPSLTLSGASKPERRRHAYRNR